MKTFISILLVMMIWFCCQPALMGQSSKKKLITNNIDIGNADFHSIIVEDALDVYITQDNINSVTVSGTKEQIKYFNSAIKSGILYLSMTKELNYKNQTLSVYVNLKQLKHLKASGASDVYGQSPIKSTNLEIEMSGASDLEMEIEAEVLKCTLSGSSDAEISGSTHDLLVKASGSSDLEAYEMISNNCELTASGSSDANIFAKNSVIVTARGSSDVYIKGNPDKRNIQTKGDSDIVIKD